MSVPPDCEPHPGTNTTNTGNDTIPDPSSSVSLYPSSDSSSARVQQQYDRQMRVIGAQAQSRMSRASVLVIGMSGVGAENAKNLILMGIRKVAVYDTSSVSWMDLADNFCLGPDDVGHDRLKAVLPHLQCLNDLCSVVQLSSSSTITGKNSSTNLDCISDSLLQQFQVVVCADSLPDNLVQFNRRCRDLGIGWVWAGSYGVVGGLFVDGGKEGWRVEDTNGEEPASGVIQSISADGVVDVCDPNSSEPHNLSEGDIIEFYGLNYNNDKPVTTNQNDNHHDITQLHNQHFRIKIVDPYRFSVDLSLDGEYTGGGYWRQIKQPAVFHFDSLHRSLCHPRCVEFDFGKIGRGYQIHLALRALHRFLISHNQDIPSSSLSSSFSETNPSNYSWPRSHHEGDADALVEIAYAINGTEKIVDTIDEDVVRILSRTARGRLNPISATIGGVAAQEAQKLVTGKFSPLQQWLCMEMGEVLPDPRPTPEQCVHREHRYDGQAAVLGWDIQERLQGQRVFLVGAGALGCEYVKNLALMGVGCRSKDGSIIVTDMDQIETSNLSRQFLFRAQHVGRMKSEVAAEACRAMNPDLAIEAHQDRVGPETENRYDADFWRRLSFVANALDNLDARLYVDGKCVEHGLGLLEGGTLGAKGNTQAVVPHLTESYGSTRDPPERTFAQCTIHTFPNTIQHTIAWAKALFEGRFCSDPQELMSFLQDREGYLSAAAADASHLATLHSLLVEEPVTSFRDCVKWARCLFEHMFVINIRTILHHHPRDATTSAGAPFWSGSKRAPSPLQFNPQDTLHRSFVECAALLRARSFGVPDIPDSMDQIQDIVDSLSEDVSFPQFKPPPSSSAMEDDPESEAAAVKKEAEKLKQMEQALRDITFSGDIDAVHPTELDKDDDENRHMEFITAASNLRARNYGIPESDLQTTKGIAGRIVPAMVTTTAVVTGLCCVELYKMVLQDSKTIEDFRNSFINLALPFLTQSEPSPAKQHQLPSQKMKWTLWDCFDIDEGKDISLEMLEDIFRDRYGLQITMLTCGQTTLMSPFVSEEHLQQRRQANISALVRGLCKVKLPSSQRYLNLQVQGTDQKSGEAVHNLPWIRYRFRFPKKRKIKLKKKKQT
eukprot:gb/GECH01009341.1/.p1 GENE.gb/GECH01009341.1/~~gb/GECH01009341.1/.p1  ORF type:complete len:1115 (+),score=224.34 gb/GECH01009341.1/:1-3345(+)